MIGHLYDIFAEKWLRPGGQVYFYADPHFGDLDCYRMRFPKEFKEYFDELDKKYPDNKETNPLGLVTAYDCDPLINKLDQMQIDSINKMCHKCDTLIILGDVGDIKCIKKLKAGRKVLIMGNHDAGVSNYKRIVDSGRVFHFSKLHSKEYMELEKKHIAELLKEGYSERVHYENRVSCTDEVHELFLDNRLFDEVYEGCLQISPKIILSHEPIEYYPYCINIHGHDHMCEQTDGHLNVIAEKINYTPICLKTIIDSGILKIPCDIHRETINYAIEKKKRKSNPMEVFQRNL